MQILCWIGDFPVAKISTKQAQKIAVSQSHEFFSAEYLVFTHSLFELLFW